MGKQIGQESKRGKKVQASYKVQKEPLKTSFGRRGKAPSFAESAALLAAVEKRKGGGNGIPGGRKFDDVMRFKSMPKDRKKALVSIINKSEKLRELKKGGGKVDNKAVAQESNFRIEYPNQFPNTAHSLHVGQDIAAVFNSNKTGGSRTYDYDTLTRSLDKRLGSNESTKGNRRGEYFNPAIKMTENQRRGKIAEGLQARLAEKKDNGQKQFAEAGLTVRGQKWVDKFSTIMLAEKAREYKGGKDAGLIDAALVNLKSNSFHTVFVTKKNTMAPFAGKGGASEFKK